jgi:DMSO/TMAO reductase YedYZ heme-binding membrane subunit
VVVAQNKAQGKTRSLSLTILKTLTRSHGLLGVTALVLGMAHGTLMFLTNEMASLTGGTLIVLLLIQGVLGVLQSKRIGNVKRWQELHEKLPYALFLVLIAHIIFNNFGY